MTTPIISYVVYVAASADRLWEALTNPEVLARNWGRIQSQWTVGSAVAEVDDSGTTLWNGTG